MNLYGAGNNIVKFNELNYDAANITKMRINLFMGQV